MLERNLRTEGPLFEGDESLLFVDGERKHVDDIALARQINKKWFLKGKNYSKYLCLFIITISMPNKELII